MELYEQIEKNFETNTFKTASEASGMVSEIKGLISHSVNSTFANYRTAVETAKKQGNYGTPEALNRYENMAGRLIGENSQKLQGILTMIEHMSLGLWLDPIGCSEDQWIPCPGHALVNQHIRVSEDKEIVVHEVDRHVTSVPRSPCEVLRINKDNNLCCMPNGVMMYVFDTPQSERPSQQMAISTWIHQWPWQPALPMTMNIFKDSQSGIVSDITSRYGFLDNNIAGHLYSPRGTQPWPKQVPAYASTIPADRLQAPMEKAPSEMTPEEING